MDLRDYILSLPDERTTARTLKIEEIAQACGVHPSTIYKWMNGNTRPDKLKMEKVSELTNIPVNELFNLSASCEK